MYRNIGLRRVLNRNVESLIHHVKVHVPVLAFLQKERLYNFKKYMKENWNK